MSAEETSKHQAGGEDNNNSPPGHVTIDIGAAKKDANGTSTEITTNGSNGKHANGVQQVANAAAPQDEEDGICGRLIMPLLYLCVLVVAVSLLWFYLDWVYAMSALFLGVVVFLLLKPGYRWFYIALVTSHRDFSALCSYLKLLRQMRGYEKKNMTIGDVFQKIVAKQPDKVAIVSEHQKWTFRELNDFSNRVANTFHDHGYRKGDVVALMLENRPEFVGTWLGLSKLGVVTALINTNLRGPSLLHSINVANCVAFVFGEDFKEAVEDISKELPSKVALYQFNNAAKQPVFGMSQDLASLLGPASSDPITAPACHANHHDKLIFIYTSGTTGMPKAAVISHSRYMFIAVGIHKTLRFRNKDVFYTPLPLYHTAGGMMSVGQALLFGSTVAIRKKFSASGYFADCAKFQCTIGQYIGEMARYILATPSSEADRRHKVRMVFGNGLRPQIWPQFVERFNIAKVGEFYGATEGNANIMNNDNTVGAIGFISRIIPQVYPISIIRVDPVTCEPIRGKNGLCQLCRPDEPGIFIGKIIKGNPSREFLGYVDKKASESKVLRDVFKKGDMAFHSGDLLVADERGYLYFKDRTGDTFRWKGENVSTSEVEAHVSNVAGYRDTVVYGVTIPNTDGRAGMAAIHDPESQVDLQQFGENISKVLPPYAKPLFLRILVKVDLTGTFKLRKVDLQKEGYDPSAIGDALYYLTSKGKYERLTPDIYAKICNNEIRF